MSTQAHELPTVSIDLDGELTTRVISISAAVLMTFCLYVSARTMPLPALEWAGAFLFLAVENDLRVRKIPNWLTLPAFLGALVLAGHAGGLQGVGQGLLGAGAVFLALFVPFSVRALGAGDVKALMVLGALWGPQLIFQVLFWMVLAGGVLALAKVVLSGGGFDLLRRWALSAKLSVLYRRPTFIGPNPGSVAAGGIPFALAMGFGMTAFQIWGNP